MPIPKVETSLPDADGENQDEPSSPVDPALADFVEPGLSDSNASLLGEDLPLDAG
jgi:hypothetical protein